MSLEVGFDNVADIVTNEEGFVIAPVMPILTGRAMGTSTKATGMTGTIMYIENRMTGFGGVFADTSANKTRVTRRETRGPWITGSAGFRTLVMIHFIVIWMETQLRSIEETSETPMTEVLDCDVTYILNVETKRDGEDAVHVDRNESLTTKMIRNIAVLIEETGKVANGSSVARMSTTNKDAGKDVSVRTAVFVSPSREGSTLIEVYIVGAGIRKNVRTEVVVPRGHGYKGSHSEKYHE
jgi:hypothetical protein